MRNRYEDEGYRGDVSEGRDWDRERGELRGMDRDDDRGGWGREQRTYGREGFGRGEGQSSWERNRETSYTTRPGWREQAMQREMGGRDFDRDVNRSMDRDWDRDRGDMGYESRFGRGTNAMYGYGSWGGEGRYGGPTSRMYGGGQDRTENWGGWGRERDERFRWNEQDRREEPSFGERVKRFGERVGQAMGMKVGKGPKGYKRSDERIREDVIDRIVDQGIDASEVEITVKDGEVTMSGFVHQRVYKHRMEDIADQVSGVKDVHNQIRVKRLDEETERRESNVLTGDGNTTRRNAGTPIGRS